MLHDDDDDEAIAQPAEAVAVVVVWRGSITAVKELLEGRSP